MLRWPHLHCWGLDGGKGASLGVRSFVFLADLCPVNRHGVASYLDGSDIISALRQFWVEHFVRKCLFLRKIIAERIP